jgi:hypothetical protein
MSVTLCIIATPVSTDVKVAGTSLPAVMDFLPSA